MKKRRSIFLSFLAISLLLGGLSSCSEDTGKKQIAVLGETTTTIQSMMTLEEGYEKNNPNIDLVFHPNTFDDAFTKSNQDFANGTGLYDIVLQYNFTLSSCVRNNYVHLIDELTADIPADKKAFEKDIFPKVWEELGYYYKDATDPSKGNVRVGYPSAALTMLMMYNREMFEDESNQLAYMDKYGKELTPPENWEDYYNIAQFFTDEEKETYGVCIEGGGGGFLYYELTNFIFGMGGAIMDKKIGWTGNGSTKVTFNSPESVKALTFYKSLKPFNAGNFSDVEQFQQMKIMKEGKTAMAFVWSDMIYGSLKSETDNSFDNRFGFSPVPGNKSILGGGSFFINRKTKNPKETADFVMHLMQPETQIELAKKGLCSPLRTTYSNEQVKALPYSDALFKSLDRGGIGLEAGPDANLVSETLTTYIQRMWNDEISPQEVVTKAHDEIVAGRKEIFSKITN